MNMFEVKEVLQRDHLVCLCQVPMPEPSLLTLQATWPGTLVRFLFFCEYFLYLQLYTLLPVRSSNMHLTYYS